MATGRTVLIERDGPLPVVADPDRITQAVMNLVDNAVRHTPAGGRIRIATSRAENAVVTITNTGAPIAPDDLDRVFNRFYRARDGISDGHHAGLGLAITKAIVEASGGSVGVASDERGTRFSIALPTIV
jgi:signal transduction histidine kinase